MEKKSMTRKQALEELSRYGIRGAEVYLIDIIPLIEMVWADGTAQDSEVVLLNDYLRHHVAHINRLSGYTALTIEAAQAFVKKFFEKRPAPGLLRTLRSLIPSVRLSSSDDVYNEALRESLLASCLDIAASAVARFPFKLDERISPEEKRCFFEILESLEGDQDHHRT